MTGVEDEHDCVGMAKNHEWGGTGGEFVVGVTRFPAVRGGCFRFWMVSEASFHGFPPPYRSFFFLPIVGFGNAGAGLGFDRYNGEMGVARFPHLSDGITS